MANELSNFSQAYKIAFVNPSNGTQIRKISGSGSGAWVSCPSIATAISEYVVTLSATGAMYAGSLPTGLDAAAIYELMVFDPSATTFGDGWIRGVYDGREIPTAAQNAAQVRTELTTELGRVDTAVSSRLAAGSYTVPLSAQATRDAMKLAPTAGAAASESIDDKLDDVETAIGNIDTGEGTGDIPVDHDYGGDDALRVTESGTGVDGATIRAYLAAEYDASTFTIRGQATTGSDGRWITPMMLDADAYTLVVSKPGEIQEKEVEIEVA